MTRPFLVAAVAVALVAAAPAAPLGAQNFRTLWTRGGMSDSVRLGTVRAMTVSPEGHVLVRSDSAGEVGFDARGRLLPEARFPAALDPSGPEVVRTADADPLDALGIPPSSWIGGDSLRVDAFLRGDGDTLWVRVVRDLDARQGDLGLRGKDPGDAPPGDTDERERWVLVRTGSEPRVLGVLVLPTRFALRAVRNGRLHGIQGEPGRQRIHVLELYEDRR